MVLFKDLEIGDKFHDNKKQGSGARSHIVFWMEYVKISKTHAKCIKQVGYGNERAVGHTYRFYPYNSFWRLNAEPVSES